MMLRVAGHGQCAAVGALGLRSGSAEQRRLRRQVMRRRRVTLENAGRITQLARGWALAFQATRYARMVSIHPNHRWWSSFRSSWWRSFVFEGVMTCRRQQARQAQLSFGPTGSTTRNAAGPGGARSDSRSSGGRSRASSKAGSAGSSGGSRTWSAAPRTDRPRWIRRTRARTAKPRSPTPSPTSCNPFSTRAAQAQPW
jgi:hypothetical protein